MSSSERKSELLHGRAVKEVVRQGTGSEHEAVVLHLDSGEQLILQRIGGNEYTDPVTSSFAGMVIDVEGFRIGDLFRFTAARLSK